MQELPEKLVFGLDIGTRSLVGTVGAKEGEHKFNVYAIEQLEHETRAMLDGQIHDIPKVSESIKKMKKRLEKKAGRELTEVCIAAAGRVLKTVNVSPSLDLVEETVITEDEIRKLEMLGVDEAYKKIRETGNNDTDFYCVGYSVMHYYINGLQISNLEEHKGKKIDAEIIATFLPQDVVDDLYAAVENAGLNVTNLTLEPIAAIDIAIPEKFRLLNIALVDVGAGTSDICITDDGCVISYGMIAHAGDELTEIIAKMCLVDFNTADQIKRDLSNDIVEFEDVMGLPQTMKSEDIIKEIQPTLFSITEEIGEKIKELNGGNSVSAVFVVGGGGKVPGFTEHLADYLELQKERVALRGKEVLGEVEFLESETVKDPLLVTPIGICYSYYRSRSNFIYVSLNGEKIKLYDNNRLTIYDAVSKSEFSNDDIFPKRGDSINYTLDGERRIERGEPGEPAVITLNGNPVSLSREISKNDVIKIKPSTAGSPAKLIISKLKEMDKSFHVIFNDKELTCPKMAEVNGSLVSGFYEINDGDSVIIRNYYTLKQIMEMLDLPYHDGILVNNAPANCDTEIYDKFMIRDNSLKTDNLTSDYLEIEDAPKEEIVTVNENNNINTYSNISFDDLEYDDDISEEDSQPESEIKYTSGKAIDIKITVNGTEVVLRGKDHYVIVDILDFYKFDMSTYKGKLILEVNDIGDKDFTTPVHNGDKVKMAWSGIK